MRNDIDDGSTGKRSGVSGDGEDSEMRMAGQIALCLGFFALAGANAGDGDAPSASAGHWPQFRGTSALGVADGPAPPMKWDVQKGENIKWKTEIPGLAHSSPIIWGDRVFVTTAVSDDPNPYIRVGLYGESPDHPEKLDHDFRVYCLDKNSGKILWQQTAHRGVPKAQRHIKSTHANSTPATDGKHVVAFFGSEGLYCYDFDGKLLWKKDLGLLDAGAPEAPEGEIQWGFASSPIIDGDRVIVQCDTRTASFLAALDVADGREIWRMPRPEQCGWGTPTVYDGDGRRQVIVNGYKHIGGYDVATGQELWKMRGGGDIPVPTPIVAHGLVYITNAHGAKAPVLAIRTSAVGDISLAEDATSNEYVAWSYAKRGNYMQTPLAYGDYLYTCRDNGTLTCYEAKTGTIAYRQRLGSGQTGFSASPVAAGGRVYFTSEEGDILVVKAGAEFELLATNPMGEICMATPAISDGRLFVRGQRHVTCIGE